MSGEKLRIDKYLWAIRIFKTRSQAATAIHAGKVKCDGIIIKASKQVSIGEHYEINTGDRKWLIKVVRLLSHRVQYSEAILHYFDLTPKEDESVKKSTSSFIEYTGKRNSKQGRPTKRNRRELGGLLDL